MSVVFFLWVNWKMTFFREGVRIFLVSDVSFHVSGSRIILCSVLAAWLTIAFVSVMLSLIFDCIFRFLGQLRLSQWSIVLVHFPPGPWLPVSPSIF